MTTAIATTRDDNGLIRMMAIGGDDGNGNDDGRP